MGYYDNTNHIPGKEVAFGREGNVINPPSESVFSLYVEKYTCNCILLPFSAWVDSQLEKCHDIHVTLVLSLLPRATNFPPKTSGPGCSKTNDVVS